jgi:hypothetical protein
MTAGKKQDKEEGGIKLTCSGCEYGWTYHGKQVYWATCPRCRNKVSLQHQRKDDSSKTK